MATGKIKLSQLKSWIEKYRTPSVLKSGETMSCLLSLTYITDLLAYIDNENKNGNKIDGLRVYFIRPEPHPLWNSKPLTQLNPGDPIDQISIAIVPTYGYSENFTTTQVNGKDVHYGGAYDYKELNDEIYVVMPGKNENSGLCPPNCGGGQ